MAKATIQQPHGLGSCGCGCGEVMHVCAQLAQPRRLARLTPAWDVLRDSCCAVRAVVLCAMCCDCVTTSFFAVDRLSSWLGHKITTQANLRSRPIPTYASFNTFPLPHEYPHQLCPTHPPSTRGVAASQSLHGWYRRRSGRHQHAALCAAPAVRRSLGRTHATAALPHGSGVAAVGQMPRRGRY